VPDRAGPVFSALADPTRRQVVGYLAEHGETTATELADILPVTRQAVSKHLAALGAAGLVERRKAGWEARYSLTPKPLSDAAEWRAEVGARLGQPAGGAAPPPRRHRVAS
jgi:DNA-binding transcriptional ArsR family regulator